MSTPPSVHLPAGIRVQEFSGPAGALAALSAGTGPDQVLLVPGFTGSKEDFLPLLPLLAREGFCVTAIDQRGQHESQGPVDPTEYALPVLAGDLLDVVEAIGSPVHLVGHSLGGLVAREAVLAEPDALRSLVLLASGPGPLPDPGHLPALINALPHMDLAEIWQVKLALDEATGAPRPPAEVSRFLEQRWLATDPASLLGMAAILLDTVDRTDELTALSARVPTSVMYGADDWDVWPPPIQEDMAERLGVRAIRIGGAAHSPATENPEATAAALRDFWRSRA